MTKLKNISFYAFIALFVFALVILYIGFKSNITILQYIAFGIISLYIVYFIIEFLRLGNYGKTSEANLEAFKDEKQKLIINLADVTIKSNRKFETVVEDNSFESLLKKTSDLSGESIKMQKVTNHYTLIIPYKKQKLEYDLKTDCDIDKLRMHFAIQKETILYVDPKNPKTNYLDLGFLHQ